MRQRMLLRRHQFLVGTLLLFFNVAACWVNYDEPLDPNNVEKWSNNLPEDRPTPGSYKSEEIAIFSKKGNDEDAKNQLYSCIKFDDDHHCKVTPLKWAKTDASPGKHYIRRLYMGAGAPAFGNSRAVYDINVYPSFFTAFLSDVPKGIKFGITRAYAYPPADQEWINRQADQTYILREKYDQCNDYPKASEGLSGISAMQTGFFYKIKGNEYITYLYIFLKKNDTICSYRTTAKKEIELHDVVQIKYPTENYAPNFFTFDEVLGAFVSLYWDGIRGHLPQVHFYVFKENQPEIVSFGEGYPLQDFDPDVLEEIFEEGYGENAYPAFVSYGKQVFISFTRKGADREFGGLWKNGTEGFVYHRPLDKFQTLIRLRKDYIQDWDLAEPYKPNYVPDPTATTKVFVPDTTISISTTPMPVTLTVPLTTTTTSAFEDNSTASSVPLTTTTATFEDNSTASSSTSEPSYNGPPAPDGGGQASSHDNNGNDEGTCDGFSYLWLMIVFIFLDVVLIIVLIILIVVSLRGAKKRKGKGKQPLKKKLSSKTASSKAKPVMKKKSKTPKEDTKKMKKKSKAPPTAKDDTKKMKKKDKTEKKKKKAVEKSVTEKNSTTADPSNYYSGDAPSEHSSKKKRGKK